MGWICKTDVIQHITAGAVDDWGISADSTINTVRCRVRTTNSVDPIINNLGNEIVPKYIISMDGATDIKAGDTIIFADERYMVASVQINRDLVGKPTISVVTV